MEVLTEEKVPVLRFPEFEGEWEEKSLGSIIVALQSGVSVQSIDEPVKKDEQKGVLKSSCVSSGIFLPNENKIISKEDIGRARLSPEEDTIIISRMNTPQLVGESGYVDKKYSNLYLPDKLWLAKLDKRYFSAKLISILLASEKIKTKLSDIATGTSSSMKNISKLNFLNVKLSLPSLPEQQKIATFIFSIDDKLQQLSQKKDLMEQYKKGVMQQLFSQEIRFKDDKGDDYPEWEEKQFEDVFTRIVRKNKENNKNVLTISAQHGLISQTDFFNKSVAAQDLTGYYLLEKGDFAYNKSYSNGYPMGAIKRLKGYEKGVVSTLYICFKVSDGNSELFYEYYFDSGLLNKELQKIAQEGARNHGLLNISVVEFFRDLTIINPSLEEQQKIAAFLSSLDAKIEAVKKQIQATQTFKKGLLQQLFV